MIEAYRSVLNNTYKMPESDHWIDLDLSDLLSGYVKISEGISGATEFASFNFGFDSLFQSFESIFDSIGNAFSSFGEFVSPAWDYLTSITF